VRLVVLALCSLWMWATPAGANTVWNVSVAATGGSETKLTTLDENPNKLLPACRCVAGLWALKSETATHFTGTLKALSFNHPRKAKTLQVKVRKTRSLMGVARDYRETLLGIVRGKGQLILREVTGGQWEVVGFAPQPLGDLFADHPRWRVDAKAKPAEPSPVIDPKSDATELVKLINDYRASLKLPRVTISPALTKVAQAHVHDLNANKPVKQSCNMHSWSEHGSWTSCCYDGGQAAARCMWAKPKEIAGYKGKGYEIAANASGITPEKALSLWQDSDAHHAVMINNGIWKKPWLGLGVAIEGDYAVAWFTDESDK
jgi:uncharacterized protein YkwD